MKNKVANFVPFSSFTDNTLGSSWKKKLMYNLKKTPWFSTVTLRTFSFLRSNLYSGNIMKITRCHNKYYGIIIRWGKRLSHPVVIQSQRFATFSKIWPLTILHLLTFIMRTNFRMSSESWGLSYLLTSVGNIFPQVWWGHVWGYFLLVIGCWLIYLDREGEQTVL